MDYNKKVILVYPEYPATFWSFKHVLRLVSKKAAYPPLGLLTVASLLPEGWEKRLIDMNITALKDEDLKWADYVFISAMIVQKESVKKLIKRCKDFDVKIVAGGPLFTAGFEEFDGVDHFVLNEAEITLPLFLKDLENGCANKIYSSHVKPDITKTPIPSWDLINMRNYATMPIQYSRGCPFDCEFCDIIELNGRIPRTKDEDQLIKELDTLYDRGWRGPVFIVDDNFIGNKAKVKKLLPSIIRWMRERNYPFSFFTEASINIAHDDELMKLMIEAGFNKVFIGIETPLEESLEECNKIQNKKLDMLNLIKKIQNYGMEVLGGFIVGFDSDPPSIFEKQINFIQNSGVVTAMVGLLNAIPGTKLYNRLKNEGRLINNSSGNNTDGSLNFIPKMDYKVLINGYKRILDTIYSPQEYYERIFTFLKEYKPSRRRRMPLIDDFKAFIKSIWFLGVLWKERKYYWKTIIKGLFKYPKAFPEAVTLTIYGFHFRKVIEFDSNIYDLSLNESGS